MHPKTTKILLITLAKTGVVTRIVTPKDKTRSLGFLAKKKIWARSGSYLNFVVVVALIQFSSHGYVYSIRILRFCISKAIISSIITEIARKQRMTHLESIWDKTVQTEAKFSKLTWIFLLQFGWTLETALTNLILLSVTWLEIM